MIIEPSSVKKDIQKIIPRGMVAADALAQNEGDAQEATSTACAFAYLFFPSSKWICKCVMHYKQSLL